VLTPDLLLVELADGTSIDVSWYPEHDPEGSYYITVFRDGHELREVEAKSPTDAVLAVQELAALFSASSRNVSCSGGVTLTPAA